MEENNPTKTRVISIISKIMKIGTVISIIFIIEFQYIKDWYWNSGTIERNLKLDGILNLIYLVLIIFVGIGIWFTSYKYLCKLILSIVAIQFLCFSTLLLMGGSTRVMASVEYGNYHYHIVSNHEIGTSWTIYELYKCHNIHMYCNEITDFYLEGAAGWDRIELKLDPEIEKIYIFRNGYLDQIYDPVFELYSMIDDIEIGEYSFKLELSTRIKNRKAILTRCILEKYRDSDCEVLFYTDSDFPEDSLMLTYNELDSILQVKSNDLVLYEQAVP